MKHVAGRGSGGAVCVLNSYSSDVCIGSQLMVCSVVCVVGGGGGMISSSDVYVGDLYVWTVREDIPHSWPHSDYMVVDTHIKNHIQPYKPPIHTYSCHTHTPLRYTHTPAIHIPPRHTHALPNIPQASHPLPLTGTAPLVPHIAPYPLLPSSLSPPLLPPSTAGCVCCRFQWLLLLLRVAPG